MIDVLLLVVGLTLLLGGGDLLVRGASALAQGLGVSSPASNNSFPFWRLKRHSRNWLFSAADNTSQ